MFEWLHNLLTPWLPGMLVTLAVTGAKIITFMVGLLIGVAYLTLAERKGLAAMQLRRGANRVGPWGLLQPFADGLKLVHKEIIIPTGADKALFLLAPVLTFGLALAAWAVMPVGQGVVIANINIGLLYVFAISSLGVYGIILAGWASNSMYALLGGVRAAAQMISYEVSMGLVILSVVLTTGSLNLTEIVNAQQGLWFMVPHFPMFVLFFIITLAETNRTPFDLPEAESELAGGYNVEYSSVPFAVFFLAEYANMILMCAITTLLFLGGWLPPFDVWPLKAVPGPIWFALKVSLLLFGFIWVRATVPRYRYDQLMAIGWKVCLPLALAWFVATALFLYITGGLPA